MGSTYLYLYATPSCMDKINSIQFNLNHDCLLIEQEVQSIDSHVYSALMGLIEAVVSICKG